MKKNTQKYFIIDFDSTFVKTEGLDELAAVSLKNHPEKNIVLNQIKQITTAGMEGKIPFDQSLAQRLKLLKAGKKEIDTVVKVLKNKITSSVKRNRDFFKKFASQIYIISGGFREIILPIVSPFKISPDHILANDFIFDDKEQIIGYRQNNFLSQKDGKVKTVKNLKLKGEVYVIGDGYTDFQIKEMGAAKNFVAFTENVYREVVTQKADFIASSFDEFLFINKLPRSLSYPKNRIKVLLLENIDSQAVKIFEDEGFPVDRQETNLADVSILGIRSRTNITSKILKNANQLLAVGAYCIGTNQIDLPACSQHGVAVFNAPYNNTKSVVELVIGEIIVLSRAIIDKNNQLHQGIWDKSAQGSHEIRGKKLGIIGYGNIGSQLSVAAESLGLEVYFYDVIERLPFGNAKKCQTLKELLKIADIISVHVDGQPKNKNFIGEKEFSLMKDGVIFLNLSRDFIVDINSLVKYLRKGKIKGAAIDVFPNEPKNKEERFLTPLQNLPNVILTPHIAGSTEEAQKNIAQFVSTKIIDYINTGSTEPSVNIPNIQLPRLNHAHRLLHLHKNVPGILAQINKIMAENKINILGQYLKTNDQIGYVITDVNKRYDEKVIRELKNIPETIRFRILY